MENPILAKRKLVQDRIEKSFDSGINVPEEVEMEKAHQDGEIHPNGKWVWVSSANGGKGDWRTRGGRTHNAHSENEKKFKQNFKNAQDGILQKIIDGKIQAGAHEKKWAQDILDERKKGSAGEKAAKKIIDLIKISSSKYSDINKVVAFKTDKGNWAIDYDGANTGLIIGKDHLSEAELKAAGVKIEGGSSKGDDDKSKQRAKTEQDTPQKVRDILKKKGYTPRTDGTWEHSDGREAFPDKNGKWVTTTKMPGVRMNVESMADESAKKKADPKQDKAAQAAGFKDYEEMKGWQDYTTAKNLLKKPSMKLKSKEADRKELEKQVADYEKDHADVIAARGGKKSGPKTSNPTDHGNTEDNAYQAYKSGRITKEQYEGITGKKSAKEKIASMEKTETKSDWNPPYNLNLDKVEKLWSEKESKEYDAALESGDQKKQNSLLKIAFDRAKEKNIDIKAETKKTNDGNFKGMKFTEILDSLDEWEDDDWNNQELNEKLTEAIKGAIKKEGIDEKKFKEIAKKYQGLDLVYEDYTGDPEGDFAKLLKPLDDWEDEDWNDDKKNKKLSLDIKYLIMKHKMSESDFRKMAKKYQGLDLVYTDYVPKDSDLYKKYNSGASKDAGKKLEDSIISAIRTDQGGLDDSAETKKKIKKIAAAAQDFISKNPKANLTSEDIDDIIWLDVDTIEERYGKFKGFKKLYDAIDAFYE